MSRQPQEPTWPFLCILACLFVLSAAAPRAWEKSLRTRQSRPIVADRAPSAQAALVPCVTNLCAEDSPDRANAGAMPAPSAQDMEVGGLILVAPNPRIALQATDRTLVNHETAGESEEVESLELVPPATRDLTSEAGDPLALPVDATIESARAESAAEIADTIVTGTTDDCDMGAVPGVSVLSLDRVAELAKQQAVVRNPIDANADWTVPVSIFEQLEPLCWHCETGTWAREVAVAARRASADVVGNSATVKQSLDRMSQLGRDGVAIAQKLQGTDQFDPMRSVLNALQRRIRVWEKIADATSGEKNHPKPVDWEQVQHSIQEVEGLTKDGENGPAWRSFLDLDTLAKIAAHGATGLKDGDLAPVRLVLVKLQVKDVTEEQRSFIESDEVAQFEQTLRTVATEPASAASWVAWIEAFERTGSPSLGERLALERLKLSVSSLPAHCELAELVEELYCGPNVRIAVTGYLLNRMLPDREPEYQWVRDTVLGHPVHGRSRTSADVGLALIPDSERMRAALTVDGLVSASTSSTAGPATFFNDSQSEYSAVKELELTPMGIQFQPAEVTADNQTRLRQVRTDFDGIPLISSLARSMAKSQHDANRPAIRREMNRKVQMQAEKQIDEEIDARLGELNHRLKNRLLDPLATMSLRPEVADAETTESRMSMQLNLAGPAQLGGNTPRPWAPSDSVLSFQVHQSALNNVLLGLELDGASMTVKELRDRIGQRFNRPELAEETTEHDDVQITFASTDAARIDFEEDRIAVSLGISRLRAGDRQWRDFRVRAYYRPEASGQSATLVRDGVVELVGSMRMGSQIALRSIFSKTFAKGRELPVIPAEIAADPRLQGLEVTQLSASDGWFALAVGPERIQPAMAKNRTTGDIK